MSEPDVVPAIAATTTGTNPMSPMLSRYLPYLVAAVVIVYAVAKIVY